MDSTAEETTARRLARSVMQFNKAFGLFNRDELQHSFARCTRGEIGVLFIIRKEAKSGARMMKVSEISKVMQVTSPTVTQLLKGLEKQGLIARHIDPNDRRAVGIALTERGNEIAQEAEKIFLDSFNDLVDYLGEEESNQLIELLLKAYHYFNERETHASYSQWNGEKQA